MTNKPSPKQVQSLSIGRQFRRFVIFFAGGRRVEFMNNDENPLIRECEDEILEDRRDGTLILLIDNSDLPMFDG